MNKLIYLTLLLLLLSACKKNKLENENADLIGRWNWTFSSHSYGWCDGDSYSETLSPETEGYQLTMQFYERGIVRYFENGIEIGKDRLVFAENSGIDCDYLENSFYFAFDLNNDKAVSSALNGCVNSDSIILTYGFPHEIFEVGCESYTSYFVRE